MSRNPRKTTLLASFLLLAGLVSTLPAQADGRHGKKLTGTWHLTAEFGGQTAHAMVTFMSDGTFIHTGAAKNNVNAHGVWKKVGPRTFVEQNREYVYDENDALVLFADTTEIIEISRDGQSYVGEAVTELKLLEDDVVVEVVEFTIYGTRMVLDY